jgi:hypothetical protein
MGVSSCSADFRSFTTSRSIDSAGSVLAGVSLAGAVASGGALFLSVVVLCAWQTDPMLNDSMSRPW